MSALSHVGDVINAGLRPLGVQVIRGRSTDPAVRTYLPARKTLAAARASGLAVGDYLDRTFAEPGATAATVEAMLRLGGLSAPVRSVCEIGPGTGRFLALVSEALEPQVYEIYETAADWLPHLRSMPRVVVRECDGRTLRPTPSASVDLVHAQKVFVYLEFWATASYLLEMARVVRPGGVVAFDVVTEGCLTDTAVTEWIASGTIFRPVPRTWLLSFLAARGLTYLGNQMIPMHPGVSELMVFRRALA